MSKIHVLQLLCPLRHCCMGAAFDPEMESRESVEKGLLAAMEKIGARHECALCDSKELHFEEGVTKFSTMEEAKPALAEIEARQVVTRMMVEAYAGERGITRLEALQQLEKATQGQAGVQGYQN
jgi:hypothetical protein